MIVNGYSIAQCVIKIKNGIMINVNVAVKSLVHVRKKNYSWNSSTCSRYLKILLMIQ